jgi:hypothetical protein
VFGISVGSFAFAAMTTLAARLSQTANTGRFYQCWQRGFWGLPTMENVPGEGYSPFRHATI